MSWQAWKNMDGCHLVFQVTSLLTPASFLDVMMQLVGVESEKEKGNSSLEVQRRALDILAGSLEGRRLKFRKSNVRMM